MVNIRNANIRLRHCQKNRQMLAVFLEPVGKPVCTDGSRQAVAGNPSLLLRGLRG